jgi:uncharacterized membrane-anchored protein YitT (DUF2179 family)
LSFCANTLPHNNINNPLISFSYIKLIDTTTIITITINVVVLLIVSLLLSSTTASLSLSLTMDSALQESSSEVHNEEFTPKNPDLDLAALRYVYTLAERGATGVRPCTDELKEQLLKGIQADSME